MEEGAIQALFERLTDLDNLGEALSRVLKKNARGGLDGIAPRDLETAVDALLVKLSEDLHSGRYVPVPYARSSMPKFDEAGESSTSSGQPARNMQLSLTLTISLTHSPRPVSST